MAFLQTFKQTENSHVFYDMDWTDWLADRNFTFSDILSVTWTVPSGITKTHEQQNGAIMRIWLDSPTKNQTHRITCRLEFAPPTTGKPNQAVQRSFAVYGVDTL